jgi:muconolactone delta-isomerase
MKILAIGKPKDLLFSLPQETQMKLVKESIEPTKQMKEKGKIIAQYYSPTAQYVFAIVDYDDAGEWMKDLNANPAMTYYDQEVYPIVDLFDALKTAGIA